jgi:hypothetical protein
MQIVYDRMRKSTDEMSLWGMFSLNRLVLFQIRNSVRFNAWSGSGWPRKFNAFRTLRQKVGGFDKSCATYFYGKNLFFALHKIPILSCRDSTTGDDAKERVNENLCRSNYRKLQKGFGRLQLMSVDYEHVHVDYFSAKQKSPARLAINPNPTVPYASFALAPLLLLPQNGADADPIAQNLWL